MAAATPPHIPDISTDQGEPVSRSSNAPNPSSMEHCDGENAAKLSNGGGSEDRLSAVPNDLLIHILLKLCDAAVAARTSVLSRRWRRVWTLLPELHFPTVNDPQRVRLALAAHEAPALQRLDVRVMDAAPGSVAVLLPIAARRLSGDLHLRVQHSGSEEEVWRSVTLQLPCFEDATSINLDLYGLGLAMPSSGIFARLTYLYLGCVKLRGPSMLGDALSSPRCPVLQKLILGGTSGLGNFTIHSESLLEMTLTRVHGLQQLNVTAPALKQLEVLSCFTKGRMILILPVANISAPQLESLMWWDDYDPKFTQLGKMENLQCLSTFPFTVYEETDYVRELQNSYCTRLLRRFELIHNLRFQLVNDLEDITNQQYLMEDITRLPDITFMSLDISGNRHSFGPSSFHVLRMCTGLRKLSLTFCGTTRRPEAQTPCPSGCVCDQPPNWKTEELALNCLREVEVCKLIGTLHEAALVERLFVWATVLQKMTVTFHCSVAESKGKEFFQMLQSFSRPGISMKGQHFA